MRTKQLFTLIFALLSALMTACTDHDSVAGVDVNGTRTFTFNLSAEGQSPTRGAAPAAPSGYSMQYILQVLNADGSTLILDGGKTQDVTTTGAFAVKLPIGKTYTCLFWAHYIPTAAGSVSEFFTTTDLQTISLIKPLSGEDQSQAFCAKVELPAEPTQDNIQVTMKRAVAQINQKSSVTMDKYSKIELTYTDVPDGFNVLTNEITVSAGANCTSAFTSVTDDFSTVPDNGKYLFHSAYVLASGNGNASLLKLNLKIFNSASTTTPIQTIDVSDVPTKKNYRTNVVNKFTSATATHTYEFEYEEWGADTNLTPPSTWDGTIPPANASYTFSGGDGLTANTAYIIGSATDLAQLMSNVNAGTDYKDKFFKQHINIDLNGSRYNWTPIGGVSKDNDNQRNFKGTFDGGMHTISNMKINSDWFYVGLFGSADGAYIANLHVSGNVVATNNAIGGEYSYVANAAVGGICGSCNDTHNCSFSGSVEGASVAGGITGYNNYGAITNSKNTGTITGKKRVGGIVGLGACRTAGCYNEGYITGEEAVGGIVGQLADIIADVYSCYNIGEISLTAGSGSDKIGAVIGQQSGSGSYNSPNYVKKSYAFFWTNHEVVFGDGVWPDGTKTWYADESNDGTGDGNNAETTSRFWKSMGSWDASNPEYPKLWWE